MDKFKKIFENRHKLISGTLLKNRNKVLNEYKQNIHNVGGDYIEPEDLFMDKSSTTFRDKPLAERVEYYKLERMENQKIWYETQSKNMTKKIKKYNKCSRGIWKIHNFTYVKIVY